MTEREATGYLQTLANRIPLKFFTDDGVKVYDEFSQIALKSLEKQIPQEPRFYNCNYYCPVCDDLVGCHNTIMKWDNKFCKHCGQAIKWKVGGKNETD